MKIKVPRELLAAVKEKGVMVDWEDLKDVCDKFAEALSENPIVPTDEQAKRMYEDGDCPAGYGMTKWGAVQWQRRMFLDPEPEIPEEVRPLLRMDIMGDWVQIHAAILEAYRRGQRSKI